MARPETVREDRTDDRVLPFEARPRPAAQPAAPAEAPRRGADWRKWGFLASGLLGGAAFSVALGVAPWAVVASALAIGVFAAVLLREARRLGRDARLLRRAAHHLADLPDARPAEREETRKMISTAIAEERETINKQFDVLGEQQRRIESGLVGLRRATERALARPTRATPRLSLPESRALETTDRPGAPELPMALSGEGGLPPIDALVRALDFPRDREDREGFAALRAALSHRPTAAVLRAAEAVLSALEAERLHVEDIVDGARDPVFWRMIGGGQSAPALAAIQPDVAALALVRGRMADDAHVREQAFRLVARFEALLADLAPRLSDAELTALGDCRSARAYLLVAAAARTPRPS